MSTTCPECEKRFDCPADHWSVVGYPELSGTQRDIIVGCLMGDATIGNRSGSGNPRFVLTNTNEKYAEDVHEKLQPFANMVTVETEDKYSTQYRVTLTHPWLENLTDWYSSGVKVFPEDLELNPTRLKHWYACDGHTDKRGRFTIAAANERGNNEKIEGYFEKLGFDVRMGDIQLYASPTESLKLFAYMHPLPSGMEYKYPEPSPKWVVHDSHTRP